MVQNLSQQIDSFNRATQTQSADLKITNTSLAELRLSSAKVEAKLAPQEGAVTALRETSQDTAKRLEKTLDKLKKISFIGKDFTGI